MLTIIAIANAVLWGGVILALLLGLLGSQRDLEARIARLDARLEAVPDAKPAKKSKK